MDRDLLYRYGIDYDKGLKRCTNDPDFYRMLLSMFLKDDSFPRAKAAYESGDYKALFSCMHELKGVTGNAGMIELYEATYPLVEILRGGAFSREDIEPLFSKVEAAYKRVCEGIELAIAK